MNQGDLLADPDVALDEAQIASAVGQLFGFVGTVVGGFDSERDQTALLADADGAQRVVKISHAATPEADVDLEGSAAVWVRDVDPTLPMAVPLPTLDGALHGTSHGRLIRLYERLPGEASRPGSALKPAAVKEFGAVAARLGLALRGFFHSAARRGLPWHAESRHDVRPMADAITDPAGRALVLEAFDRFETDVAPRWAGLRAQPVHTDLTLDNLLLDDDDHVCGVLDFGDLTHTALVWDVAAALSSVASTRTGRDLHSTIGLFLDGYTAFCPLEPVEREVLVDTLRLRTAITLSLSAGRRRDRPDVADYLSSWDAGAWSLLRELEAPQPKPTNLRARRDRVFGTVLAPLTYSEPLTPVRGSGATLYDADGREYLDAYNNVPVVGHAHPRVATAIADQARLLSTNLRYLHPRAIELAERLVATMPAGLDTVLFLNSGSEAVDLAWRIAEAATGKSGALVSDFAYHGVTTATTALSPEQWRGGWAPEHVRTFAVGSQPEADGVAAVFIEPTYTSDGILVPGKDYHASLTASAHEDGALVVADEVQAGFGRAGDHLWSFVGAGITPDVVTLGKPMGNGFPVAAVIARRADVEALAERTEFFSTYAGGPVAAAAATAVLDVIADENLIEHAGAMGVLLRQRLAESGYDVRGRGLLIGVDLGDAAHAGRVLDCARRNGVLIGSTGPRSDVLKIRPPLVITPEQVEKVAATVLNAIEREKHEK